MGFLYRMGIRHKHIIAAFLLAQSILFRTYAGVSEEVPEWHFFTEAVVDLGECGLTIPSDTDKLEVSFFKNSAVIARETIRKRNNAWGLTVPKISVAQVDLDLGIQFTSASGNISTPLKKTWRIFSNSWSWKNLKPPEYFLGTKDISAKTEQALTKLGAKATDDPMACASNVHLMFGLDFEEIPERKKEMLILLQQGKNIIVFEPFKGRIALEVFKGYDLKMSSFLSNLNKSPLGKMHSLKGQGLAIRCFEGEAGIIFPKEENVYASIQIGTGPFLTFTSLDFIKESEYPLLLAYLLHAMKGWDTWNKDWFNELYENKN